MTAVELAAWADKYVTPPEPVEEEDPDFPGIKIISQGPKEGITDASYCSLYALAAAFDWKVPLFAGPLIDWDDEAQENLRIIAAHVAAARSRLEAQKAAVKSSEALHQQIREMAPGFGLR